MWWHILEIEQTSDIKAIKKAYAKLIRLLDQDEDIDEFTKVNDAYREAIGTLAEQRKKDSFISSGQSDREYLEALHELYNHPTKRFNIDEWKNIFACMSFIEEEDFANNFTYFFNEHYYLTDEIWNYMTSIYPLMEQKNFRWKDLCTDNFMCSNEEIKGLSVDEVLEYVNEKVTVFMIMSRMEYENASKKIMTFIERFGISGDMAQWYMVCALFSQKHSDVETIINKIDESKEYDSTRFLYAQYLFQIGYDKEAKQQLLGLPDHLMVKQRQFLLSDIEIRQGGPNSENISWLGLENLSSKEIKLLSTGQYKKILGKGKRFGKGSVFGLYRY